MMEKLADCLDSWVALYRGSRRFSGSNEVRITGQAQMEFRRSRLPEVVRFLVANGLADCGQGVFRRLGRGMVVLARIEPIAPVAYSSDPEEETFSLLTLSLNAS